MKIFILTHQPYKEDLRIIGAYLSEEKAKKMIQTEIELDKSINPGFPTRYEQREAWYNIIEVEVEE